MSILPRITVVTPSFNQGEFIEQTIQSVLHQEYPDLEYFVMDGGSTDGTLTVLRKYSRALKWISEKDGGQSEAINKGMKMATGEVIGFLNSDDLYTPGALLTIGRFFRDHPRSMWATGFCRNINSVGREIRRPITAYKVFWLLLNSWSVLKVLNYISQPATFWRHEVLGEVGYLDQDLHYAMDYDYWLRLRNRYPLNIVKATLACFRIHPASKNSYSANTQFDSEYLIARRHVRSRLLLSLHNAHRFLVVACYHWLFSHPYLKSPTQINVQDR